MLSFLGLTSYSQSFIPLYSEHTAPLRALFRPHGMRNAKAVLDWTVEAEASFITLKQLLYSTENLATPDHSRTFYLAVSVTDSTTRGVLFQMVKDKFKCILVSHLTHIKKPQPPCTRYVAGLAATLKQNSSCRHGQPIIGADPTRSSGMRHVLSLHITTSDIGNCRGA